MARKFANMDQCSVLYDRDKTRVDLIVDQAKKHNADGVIVGSAMVRIVAEKGKDAPEALYEYVKSMKEVL